MIDTSHLFRQNNKTIEIFVTGLSVLFTRLVKNEILDGVKDIKEHRLDWISTQIKTYLSKTEPNLPIILDCRMENFFISYIAKNVIDLLKLDKVKVLMSVHPKDVLDGCEFEVDLLSYTDYCYFYTNLINEKIDWENIEVDIPIMSLSGRPSLSRARFAKDLLDICGDRARVSLGNTTHYKPSLKLQREFENILHPYSYPLRQHTDGKTLGDITSLQQDTGRNLYKSLIAIVNETNDFSIDNIHLSEKSFKFFAWHQIPVFNSSPKQVETIRGLGFDLFDDIIDHSYDTAPNIHLHRLKLLNTISKFLRDYPTIDEVNRLRREIYPRLEANNLLLMELNSRKKFKPWPEYN